MSDLNGMLQGDKLQIANYIAIEILERLGVFSPTQEQIDRMEDFLARYYSCN